VKNINYKPKIKPMKTIKFIGKDVRLDTVLLDGVMYKAYKIGEVPRVFEDDKSETWFNYKGYTYLLA
tara:strand:- start:703 stop:903 length:201 start_codon:yes stop_codon:yes gene_type:complete